MKDDLKICLVTIKSYKTLELFINLICRVNDVKKSKFEIKLTYKTLYYE